MSYFVEVVTEDLFYENLTLGVVRVLESSPCVKNVQIDRRNPCEKAALAAWEQRHGCILPEDLRNFYSSIDGFLLTWSFEVAGEEFPIGQMEIGNLLSLRRFIGTKEQQLKGESCDEDPWMPNFGSSYKLFDIGQCNDSKVFLVYKTSPDQEEPRIWLHHNSSNQWYHLADNFTKYFKMMLVHLGLPLWQYCAAEMSLPMWVEQVYLLVAPHLLPTTAKPGETISTNLWNDGPTNIIDPAIFKAKENKKRNTKK